MVAADPRYGFQPGRCPTFPDGIPSGADAAQTPATSTARDAAYMYLLVGLPVRPVGHQAQSCAIALRSPASEQSSDLTRMSPDFHKISQLTSKMPPTAPTTARASEPRSAHHRTALYAGDSLAQDA